MPLVIELTNKEFVTVTLAPVEDDLTTPAALDGVPTWEPQDGSSTVEVAADGLSAKLITGDGEVGDSVFLVRADAKIGEGVVEIADTVTLRVSNPMAKSLGISAGAIEKKPVPPV